MKYIFLSSLFWISLVFHSCNSSNPSVFEKIINTDKGDFRGVSMRSGPEAVRQIESVPPKNEESDYLFYEISLNGVDEYYTVGYSFNEKGLYEILLDVNLKKTEDALLLFQELKQNFQSRFGNPKQEDETTIVWAAKTENSEEVEITLSDESASYDSGKISVSFYDLAY